MFRISLTDTHINILMYVYVLGHYLIDFSNGMVLYMYIHTVCKLVIISYFI